MRRVFLTTDAVGGVWTYTLDLARAFSRAEIEVVLAVLGPPPDRVRAEEAGAIEGLKLIETRLPLEWIALTRGEVGAGGRALAAIARREAPDVVHLNHPAFCARTGWPTPVVAALHSCVGTWWRAVRPDDLLPQDFRWRVSATRAGLAAADQALVPSRAFRDAAAALYPEIDFRVVHNGRDGEPPMHPANRAGIFASGRLWDEAKNMRALDEAAAHSGLSIAAAGPTVGPNGARIDLPHLDLLGEIPNADLRARLRETAIYVSAALYEPFGLGVLESAQAGCALVLANIATFRELWDGAAVFVDPRDPGSIAAALRRLQRDDARRHALADAAAMRAASYTASRMAADTLTVYTELTATAHLGAA